jgi:CheY-like chemotaxis protein
VTQYRDWERQNRPWDKQLIIGISAHANVNDGGQGLQAGMDAFHAKPVTMKILTELQSSSVAVLRTRKLDEWESSVNRGHLLNIEPPALYLEASLFEASSPSAMAAGRAPVPTSSMSEPATTPVCLIATDTPPTQSNTLRQQLEALGWKVVVTTDGADLLRLLQMRNWDAVLIDDELPQLPGVSCITAFRKWEEQNRVNGQKNIFLVCEGNIPSPRDENSRILLPNGCSGVLRKPVPLADLQYLLHANGVKGGMDIVVRGG